MIWNLLNRFVLSSFQPVRNSVFHAEKRSAAKSGNQAPSLYRESRPIERSIPSTAFRRALSGGASPSALFIGSSPDSDALNERRLFELDGEQKKIQINLFNLFSCSILQSHFQLTKTVASHSPISFCIPTKHQEAIGQKFGRILEPAPQTGSFQDLNRSEGIQQIVLSDQPRDVYKLTRTKEAESETRLNSPLPVTFPAFQPASGKRSAIQIITL